MQALHGNEIIICLNANATSSLWQTDKSPQNRITERRGTEIEGLIAEHRLSALNRPGNAPTFHNIHGKSNIDVILATNSIANRINYWRVHLHEINSDHNLIIYDIKAARINQEIYTKSNNRFSIKRANWEAYRTHLNTLMSQNETQSQPNEPDAQKQSEHIDSIILQAANKVIPRNSKFSKSVPWWNHRLTELRKNVFDASHRGRDSPKAPADNLSKNQEQVSGSSEGVHVIELGKIWGKRR